MRLLRLFPTLTSVAGVMGLSTCGHEARGVVVLYSVIEECREDRPLPAGGVDMLFFVRIGGGSIVSLCVCFETNVRALRPRFLECSEVCSIDNREGR